MTRSRNIVVIAAALLGFSLRAIVPAGYMVASLEDGTFVKFCPAGVPAEVMGALLGHDHHHPVSGESAIAQCDLGGGSGGTVAADPDQLAPYFSDATSLPSVPESQPAVAVPYRSRPRAPPVSPVV